MQARQALPLALGNGKGNYDDLVDPRLDGDFDKTEAARLLACAAAARRRPKMSKNVMALQGEMPLEELNDGVWSIGARRRVQLELGVRVGAGVRVRARSHGSYAAQMERIRRAALPSPEYSADYPGSIPEFGHPLPASSSSDEP